MARPEICTLGTTTVYKFMLNLSTVVDGVQRSASSYSSNTTARCPVQVQLTMYAIESPVTLLIRKQIFCQDKQVNHRWVKIGEYLRNLIPNRVVQKKTVFTTGGGGVSYLIPTIVDVFDNYLVNHVIDKLLLTLGNSIYTFPYRLTQCTHSTLLSNCISVKYDVGTSGAQLTAPKRMSSVHRGIPKVITRI